MKYGGKAATATGKSIGGAVLHPSQTLRGAGSAMKTATVGAAAGYVGWEKLTTDKSVVRIVSDAIVGEKTSDAIGNTLDSAGAKVSNLTDKAEGPLTVSASQLKTYRLLSTEFPVLSEELVEAMLETCSRTFSAILAKAKCQG